MFKKFKKPEPEPKSVKHYFKEEDIPKFYKFYDIVRANDRHLDRYRMWGFICKTLNLDPNGSYTIKIDNIAEPYILEKK